MKNTIYKVHNQTQASKLKHGKISDLDIFLLPENFDLTLKYFESHGVDFIQEADLYFEQLSKDTPPLQTLVYETGYSRLAYYISQFHFFLSNIFSSRNINTPFFSKNMYEKLSLRQREINFSLKPIVQLRNDNPILTTDWVAVFDRTDAIRRAINKIGAINILECGVGEGALPFSYCLKFPQEFSNLNWCAFDFSIFRVLNARSLFKNHFATRKNDNTYFYNGDAKNLIHEDKTFHAAISCLVMEQIKYGKMEALFEMARVAEYVILCEPLFEYQSIFAKAHFRKNDYVNLYIKDLQQIGEIILIEKHSLKDPTYEWTTIIIKTKKILNTH